MSIDKNKIALETALEEELELKQELSFLQAYIDRLRKKVGNVQEHKVENIEKKEEVIKVEGSDMPNDYTVGLSLSKKFISLLKHYKRFLHFREVAEMMIKIEPELGDAKKLAAKISAATQGLKGKHIVKHQVDNDNRKTYWGVQDWLNQDGTVKQAHMYKEGFGRRGGSTEALFDF